MSATMLLSIVANVRRALTRVVYARAVLLALGVALSAWLVVDGVRLARDGASIGQDPRAGMAFGLALVGAMLVSGILAGRRARGISDVRAALWIEERDDDARPASFALVTLIFLMLGLLEVGMTRDKLAAMANRTAGRVIIEAATESAAKFRRYMLVRALMSVLTGET